MHVWALGLSCETASKTPPKFNEKTPREQKKTKVELEEGKNAKFWAVQRRAVRRGRSGALGSCAGGPAQGVRWRRVRRKGGSVEEGQAEGWCRKGWTSMLFLSVCPGVPPRTRVFRGKSRVMRRWVSLLGWGPFEQLDPFETCETPGWLKGLEG